MLTKNLLCAALFAALATVAHAGTCTSDIIITGEACECGTTLSCDINKICVSGTSCESIEDCEKFSHGEEDPCSGKKLRCGSGYCTAGQYCDEVTPDDSSSRTCVDTKPIVNKNSSDCPSTANTASEPMSPSDATTKIGLLEDMAAYMEVMRNYFVKKGAADALTACEAISTAYATANCASVTCSSSSSLNPACCDGGSKKDTCEDAPSDWKKGVVTNLKDYQVRAALAETAYAHAFAHIVPDTPPFVIYICLLSHKG